jgi:signal transduction histidine kinase
LWLATIHILGDAIVVLTSGLVVLAAVLVALLAWPLGYVGIPLSAGANRFVYRVAGWERARARITRGQVIPPLIPPPPGGSRVADARLAVTDRGMWQQFLYYLLLLPLAIVWLGLIAAAWSVPPVLIALPLYYDRFAAAQAQLGPFVIDSVKTASMVAIVAAVFLLVVSPWLMRLASALDAELARRLLGRSESGALAERVTQLVTSRQQVVDSVEAERRRMERDLHDGAQQRLVSVVLLLRMAGRRYGGELPAEVRALLAGTVEELQTAITELRELARGIRPAILTEAGLVAAVRSLADRIPVDVALSVGEVPRLDAAVEATAYFVTSEALTNALKHAQTDHVAVRIAVAGAELRVEVTDTGVGGADVEGGTGLAGLRDRVQALGGELEVSGGTGGTTVRAVIPLGEAPGTP